MRRILSALLIVVVLSMGARSEEPHTFRGKTVEGWLAIFRDKASTDARRSEAAVMLGCFGPEARSAAPELIEAVRKGKCHDEAVGALLSIGAGADVTTPIWVDQFNKKRWLGDGPEMGTFHHPDSAIGPRTRIGELLVPALQKALDGPDPDLREHAAHYLADIGLTARPTVPSIIRTLEGIDDIGADEILFDDLLYALGRIGPEAGAAIPALNRRLDQGRAGYDLGVWALDRIGTPPVQKLLDEFLRDGEPYMADLLAWIGPRANAAVPRLRATLSDGRLRFRVYAAIILAHIDRSATDVIPVLIDGLDPRGDEAIDIGEVAEVLGRFGPSAKLALPVLASFPSKDWADGRVLKAMVKIDPNGEKCVPTLIQALENEDSEVAHIAANCLGLLGPRAREAIPALSAVVTRVLAWHLVTGDDPRTCAAKALRRVGPAGKAAIPALIRAVRDRRQIVGEHSEGWGAAAAAEALGSFGSEARSAIPALVEVLQSHDKNVDDRAVRRAAAPALGRIRPEARAAIAALRADVEEHEEVYSDQAEAVVALYQVAPDGRQIAERWLQRPVEWSTVRELFGDLRERAMVLGAIGRTSFESDWVTRLYLKQLESELAHSVAFEAGPIKKFEFWFEEIGRLGTAARLAIPRLKELCSDPSPFVRMWAAEALERITPHK